MRFRVLGLCWGVMFALTGCGDAVRGKAPSSDATDAAVDAPTTMDARQDTASGLDAQLRDVAHDVDAGLEASADVGGRDVGDTCEGADLQTSAFHCGRCNHDCKGGACVRGKCAPLKLSTLSGDVVVDDDFVFIASESGGSGERGIARLAKKNPGTPRWISTVSYWGGIAERDSSVLVANDTEGVMLLAKSGGSAGVKLGAGTSPAVMTGKVAWFPMGNRRSVASVGLDGGDLTKVITLSDRYVRLIATGPSHVFWTHVGLYDSQHSISRAKHSGGDVEVIGVSRDPLAMVYVNGGVLWLTRDDGVYRVADGSREVGLVAGSDGACPMDLPAFVADATRVYWVSRAGGCVGSAMIQGGGFEILAADLSFGLTSDSTVFGWQQWRHPQRLAQDADSLYFATDEGTYRLAK